MVMFDFIKLRHFLLVLAFGTAIRELLAPFTGHPYDFELWVRVGYYVAQGADPYFIHPAVAGLSFPGSENPAYPGYPPLWPLLLGGIYKIYAITGIQNRFFYYFLIKQPIVLADIANAFVISKLVNMYSNPRNGLRALTFWLLCPYTIIISSVWGMFDPLILLLILFSICFVLRTSTTSALEALGIALKLFPIIFLPFFAGIQSSWKKMILYLGLTLSLAVVLIYLPYAFFGSWHVSTLNNVQTFDAYRVANSINYWEVVRIYAVNYGLSQGLFQLVAYCAWIWVPAVLVANYFCISSVRKLQNPVENAMMCCLFITLIYLLTKSAVSEQFVIYFLGFAIFDYFINESRSKKILFHAVWVTALAYLILNSQLMTIFLSPLSTYFVSLNFFASKLEITWDYLISSVSVLLSVFLALYAFTTFRAIRAIKIQGKGLEKTAVPVKHLSRHK